MALKYLLSLAIGTAHASLHVTPPGQDPIAVNFASNQTSACLPSSFSFPNLFGTELLDISAREI